MLSMPNVRFACGVNLTEMRSYKGNSKTAFNTLPSPFFLSLSTL